MSIWVEIRCENRGNNDDCPSNRNQGPMGNFNDTMAGVENGYRILATEATKEGWRRFDKPCYIAGRSVKGWVCQDCQDLGRG